MDPQVREVNALPELGADMPFLRKIFRHAFYLLAKNAFGKGKGMPCLMTKTWPICYGRKDACT